MTSQKEIIAGIGAIALEKLDVPSDLEDIGPDTLLIEGGLELDSFSIVELISQLETKFSFEFSESDFREEHFQSIGTLGRLVDRYVNG